MGQARSSVLDWIRSKHEPNLLCSVWQVQKSLAVAVLGRGLASDILVNITD